MEKEGSDRRARTSQQTEEELTVFSAAVRGDLDAQFQWGEINYQQWKSDGSSKFYDEAVKCLTQATQKNHRGARKLLSILEQENLRKADGQTLGEEEGNKNYSAKEIGKKKEEGGKDELQKTLRSKKGKEKECLGELKNFPSVKISLEFSLEEKGASSEKHLFFVPFSLVLPMKLNSDVRKQAETGRYVEIETLTTYNPSFNYSHQEIEDLKRLYWQGEILLTWQSEEAIFHQYCNSMDGRHTLAVRENYSPIFYYKQQRFDESSKTLVDIYSDSLYKIEYWQKDDKWVVERSGIKANEIYKKRYMALTRISQLPQKKAKYSEPYLFAHPAYKKIMDFDEEKRLAPKKQNWLASLVHGYLLLSGGVVDSLRQSIDSEPSPTFKTVENIMEGHKTDYFFQPFFSSHNSFYVPFTLTMSVTFLSQAGTTPSFSKTPSFIKMGILTLPLFFLPASSIGSFTAAPTKWDLSIEECQQLNNKIIEDFVENMTNFRFNKAPGDSFKCHDEDKKKCSTLKEYFQKYEKFAIYINKIYNLTPVMELKEKYQVLIFNITQSNLKMIEKVIKEVESSGGVDFFRRLVAREQVIQWSKFAPVHHYKFHKLENLEEICGDLSKKNEELLNNVLSEQQSLNKCFKDWASSPHGCDREPFNKAVAYYVDFGKEMGANVQGTKSKPGKCVSSACLFYQNLFLLTEENEKMLKNTQIEFKAREKYHSDPNGFFRNANPETISNYNCDRLLHDFELQLKSLKINVGALSQQMLLERFLKANIPSETFVCEFKVIIDKKDDKLEKSSQKGEKDEL